MPCPLRAACYGDGILYLQVAILEERPEQGMSGQRADDTFRNLQMGALRQSWRGQPPT